MVTTIQKHNGTGISQQKAMYYLKTIWKDAPEVEIEKAGIVCATYGLNPLLGQVFLLKYHNAKTNKDDWKMVLGIKANRQIAQLHHSYGYADGPRVMTEAEQMTIFGEVLTDRYTAITVIKDKNGNLYPGYGTWLKADDVRGNDKGNTKLNMAFIRSERQALDKMAPGEQPDSIDVVDGAYEEIDVKGIDFKTAIEQGAKESHEEATKDIEQLFDKMVYPIYIELPWLRESLTKLKWTSVIDHLKTKYGCTKARVGECLEEMNKEQQYEFMTEVKNKIQES